MCASELLFSSTGSDSDNSTSDFVGKCFRRTPFTFPISRSYKGIER